MSQVSNGIHNNNVKEREIAMGCEVQESFHIGESLAGSCVICEIQREGRQSLFQGERHEIDKEKDTALEITLLIADQQNNEENPMGNFWVE